MQFLSPKFLFFPLFLILKLERTASRWQPDQRTIRTTRQNGQIRASGWIWLIGVTDLGVTKSGTLGMPLSYILFLFIVHLILSSKTATVIMCWRIQLFSRNVHLLLVFTFFFKILLHIVLVFNLSRNASWALRVNDMDESTCSEEESQEGMIRIVSLIVMALNINSFSWYFSRSQWGYLQLSKRRRSNWWIRLPRQTNSMCFRAYTAAYQYFCFRNVSEQFPVFLGKAGRW